ncbi:PadR family transcriptional regulator [Glutamicibacter uratoxydans]|uniref:PadR family transcriptional regulator n=1 Tax=Glutamicibacter uratoxydans TaxID=43667 RepID=UPI003D6EFD65
MNHTKLVGQLKRALLPYVILRRLREGPTHGYSILLRLERIGLPSVKSGTLYPLLRSMEEAGEVTAHWETPEQGPARKKFEITEQGLKSLQDLETWIDEIV